MLWRCRLFYLVDGDADVVDDGDSDDVYYTWRSWRSFFLFVVIYFLFVAINLFVIVEMECWRANILELETIWNDENIYGTEGVIPNGPQD